MDIYPRVSIGIATYNHSKYLAQCLDSVFYQTYPNIEVILIDDCSTDDTHIVLNQYLSQPQIKFHRNNNNKGIINTYNDLLNKATGIYFIIVGDDDFLDRDYIAKMVILLENNSFCKVAFGKNTIMNESGNDSREIKSNIDRYTDGIQYIQMWLEGNKKIQQRSFIMMFVKTIDIINIGGFPDFPMGQHADNALFMNLIIGWKVGYDSSTCYYYRVYSQSYGNSHVKEVGEASMHLLKYFDENILGVLDKHLTLRQLKRVKTNLKIFLIKVFYNRIALYYMNNHTMLESIKLTTIMPNSIWKYLYMPKLFKNYITKNNYN